jgi:hypothetical protein
MAINSALSLRVCDFADDNRKLLVPKGGLTYPSVLLSISGLFDFLSSSTISGLTLLSQLALFALFCDLDVTSDFQASRLQFRL